MKKLLSFLGVLSITTSSIVVSGCSFAKNKEEYYKELIKENVKIAAYAARSGILSTNENYSPTFTMKNYGDKYVKDVYPDIYAHLKDQGSISSTTTMENLWGITFGVSSDDQKKYDYSFTKGTASLSPINFNGTKTPFDTSILSVLGQIGPLLFILANKFNINTADEIESLLKSPQFSSYLGNIGGIAKYFSIPLLSGLSNAFKAIPTDWTYNQSIRAAGIDLGNFINFISSTHDSKNYKDAFTEATATTYPTDMKNLISSAFEDIIKNGIRSNIIDAFVSDSDAKYGLPAILGFGRILLNYISQFNMNGVATNAQHLFDKNDDNLTYKKKIDDEKYKTSKEKINLPKLFQLLQLFFSPDSQNDPNGYNTLRLFNILFDNQSTDSLNSKNIKQTSFGVIFTVSKFPALSLEGMSSIWSPFLDGAAIGAINGEAGSIGTLVDPLITSDHTMTAIYKILFDFSNNAKDFSDINAYLKAIEFDIDTVVKIPFIPSSIKDVITEVKTYIDDIIKFLTNTKTPNGIYENLYQGGFLANIFNEINTLTKKQTISKQVIADFPDLKTTFNDKLTKILDLVNVKLPNYLYLFQDLNINDFFDDIAKQFEVPSRYADVSKTSYTIGIQELSDLFKQLGQTADTTAKANSLTIADEKVTGLDPTKTSTIAYALKVMSLPNISAQFTGIAASFDLLGINHKQGSPDSFYSQSVFQTLGNLYDQGGMSKIFTSIGAFTKDLQIGMNNNFNKNYLPHLTDSNFNLKLSSIKTAPVKSSNEIDTSFELDYTVNSTTIKRYRITIYREPSVNVYWHWKNWEELKS